MTKGKAVRLAASMAAKSLLFITLLLVAHSASGQNAYEFKRFDRLSVGVNVGSTGLGIEFSTPITSWARARVGASFMPGFNVPMNFGVSSYVSGQGVTPLSDKFDKINNILENFAGMSVNSSIDMDAHATMRNLSLLVDFYPLRNKHFYVTAGFYWGPRKIGHIENNIREMPTLMGILVYNKLYDFFVSERYLDEPLYNDVYFDPDKGDLLREKFLKYGTLGAHVGDFKSDGKPYMMEPDKDGVIEANMFVNCFKPYLGLGYDCYLSRDHQWSFGVNAGLWIWGGAPDIITHDGVNMVADLKDIGGKVGTYVDITKALKVYPVINVTLRYNISL